MVTDDAAVGTGPQHVVETVYCYGRYSAASHPTDMSLVRELDKLTVPVTVDAQGIDPARRPNCYILNPLGMESLSGDQSHPYRKADHEGKSMSCQCAGLWAPEPGTGNSVDKWRSVR